MSIEIIQMDEYLKKNHEHWVKGHSAENVESFVFRPYARILKYEFGMDGSRGEKLLDFGCGQGAALRFFKSKGFDVNGVDISHTGIQRCKDDMPEIADHFSVIDPKPARDDSFFGGQFDLVVAFQSLYYYSNEDMDTRLHSLYDMMKTGGIIYASMIGPGHYLYDHSTEFRDGLRRIEVKLPRIQIEDHFANFTTSKDQLLQRFRFWEKKHIGYYDAQYREDEGASFHFTFVGQKV